MGGVGIVLLIIGILILQMTDRPYQNKADGSPSLTGRLKDRIDADDIRAYVKRIGWGTAALGAGIGIIVTNSLK